MKCNSYAMQARTLNEYFIKKMLCIHLRTYPERPCHFVLCCDNGVGVDSIEVLRVLVIIFFIYSRTLDVLI